jgi:hypothetical protein
LQGRLGAYPIQWSPLRESLGKDVLVDLTVANGLAYYDAELIKAIIHFLKCTWA